MRATEQQTQWAIDGRGLVKTFGRDSEVRALDGVSIQIEANAFYTLLGPSGCGKTTLLRLIGGFETQDSGSIYLHGEKLDGLPPWRRPVNTVFQSYAVFPHMTVAQNIAFGLEMQRRPRSEITARVAEMLALVRLDGLGGRKPSQLSGGQQQRVALARALASSPRVLLLDEPLSALDLKLRTEMQLELKRLQAALGITFIFVTHDQNEALTMSDRIAVMRGGRILQIGSPEDIYERPATRFVADFIGETNLIDAEPLGKRRFRLPSGDVLTACDDAPGRILAIRPERAWLADPGQGVAGVVEQVVYLGTDTTYHVALAGGVRLRLREQNRGGARPRAGQGESVGVVVPDSAVRVLAE
jgi:spermidine/putrescine transport system ATP-binding protein